MIVRATATAAADLGHTPIRWRPPKDSAPRNPALPAARDFGVTGWMDLDDETDTSEAGHEADAADAALLRCVGCAAFATLVLALVSSLQMA